MYTILPTHLYYLQFVIERLLFGDMAMCVALWNLQFVYVASNQKMCLPLHYVTHKFYLDKLSNNW